MVRPAPGFVDVDGVSQQRLRLPVLAELALQGAELGGGVGQVKPGERDLVAELCRPVDGLVNGRVNRRVNGRVNGLVNGHDLMVAGPLECPLRQQ